MAVEFIVVGSCVALVAGRLVWEKFSNKPAPSRPGEEREWFNAIK